MYTGRKKKPVSFSPENIWAPIRTDPVLNLIIATWALLMQNQDFRQYRKPIRLQIITIRYSYYNSLREDKAVIAIMTKICQAD